VIVGGCFKLMPDGTIQPYDQNDDRGLGDNMFDGKERPLDESPA